MDVKRLQEIQGMFEMTAAPCDHRAALACGQCETVRELEVLRCVPELIAEVRKLQESTELYYKAFEAYCYKETGGVPLDHWGKGCGEDCEIEQHVARKSAQQSNYINLTPPTPVATTYARANSKNSWSPDVKAKLTPP